MQLGVTSISEPHKESHDDGGENDQSRPVVRGEIVARGGQRHALGERRVLPAHLAVVVQRADGAAHSVLVDVTVVAAGVVVARVVGAVGAAVLRGVAACGAAEAPVSGETRPSRATVAVDHSVAIVAAAIVVAGVEGAEGAALLGRVRTHVAALAQLVGVGRVRGTAVAVLVGVTVVAAQVAMTRVEGAVGAAVLGGIGAGLAALASGQRVGGASSAAVALIHDVSIVAALVIAASIEGAIWAAMLSGISASIAT